MPRCIIVFEDSSTLKPCEEACFFGRKWLAPPGVVILDSVPWEQSIPEHGGSYQELNGSIQPAGGRSPPVFARVSSTSYGEKHDSEGLLLRQSLVRLVCGNLGRPLPVATPKDWGLASKENSKRFSQVPQRKQESQ